MNCDGKELISVIVPVYNTQKYLVKCVDSIRAQTYKNIEIILVDDGSTDNSLQICMELAEKGERIIVIHKDNGGSSTARNLGIANANGVYIGFVDSDDYIEEDMYEKLYNAICRNSVQMAQCARDEIDQDGNMLQQICIPPAEDTVIDGRLFFKELLLHKGDASFCTKLTHRSLFAENRFPEGQLNEDFHLLVKMLPYLKEGIASIHQTGYHVYYRMGSNTRTENNRVFSKVYADNVRNADMIEEITQKDDNTMRTLAKRFGLFQRLDYMLHIPIGEMNTDNEFYQNVVRYLRKNILDMLRNRYLTGRDKLYLSALTVLPRAARKLHLIVMKTRKNIFE